MQPAPRRLKAKRLPLLRRPSEPPEEGWNALALPTNRRLVRRMRAVRRALTIVLWTLISLLIQSLMIVLPGFITRPQACAIQYEPLRLMS